MSSVWKGPLEMIDEFRWRIPSHYKQGMRADAVVVTDSEGLEVARDGEALEQLANSACSPGRSCSASAFPIAPSLSLIHISEPTRPY